MKVALLRAKTTNDIPYNIDKVIDNIVESDADVFVGPDNLFCGSYETSGALAMIKHIAKRTRGLDTLIFPGTFTLQNTKSPVLPMIYQGNFCGLHEKRGKKQRAKEQRSSYTFDGITYCTTICSEIEDSRKKLGLVDIHVMSTEGIYPEMLSDKDFGPMITKGFRARDGGYILWSDGSLPTTAVLERKKNRIVSIPPEQKILDTQIYDINL